MRTLLAVYGMPSPSGRTLGRPVDWGVAAENVAPQVRQEAGYRSKAITGPQNAVFAGSISKAWRSFLRKTRALNG